MKATRPQAHRTSIGRARRIPPLYQSAQERSVDANAGAAVVYQQSELTPATLEQQVTEWLQSPDDLQQMATKAKTLAITDSAARLATMIRELIENYQ